jgi:hypothetical protein
MKEFVVPKYQIAFASIFGLLLFTMNFVIIFSNSDEALKNPIFLGLIILGSMIYISFILTVIREPVKPLREMTQEEIEENEYDRVSVEDDFVTETSTFSSDDI